MEKEKKIVCIINSYQDEEKYFALTKDQIKLLRWLDTEAYLNEDIRVKVDIELPEIIELLNIANCEIVILNQSYNV